MKPHPRQSDKVELTIYFDHSANPNGKPSGDFVITINGECHSADELRGLNHQAAIALLALLLGNSPGDETWKRGDPLKILQSRNAANRDHQLNP